MTQNSVRSRVQLQFGTTGLESSVSLFGSRVVGVWLGGQALKLKSRILKPKPYVNPEPYILDLLGSGPTLIGDWFLQVWQTRLWSRGLVFRGLSVYITPALNTKP